MPESCHSESTWKFKNSTLFSIEGKEGFLFFAEIYLLFSCSVMSDSLRPRGLQHARLPCPSPSPRVCSNSCDKSTLLSPDSLTGVGHGDNTNKINLLYFYTKSFTDKIMVILYICSWGLFLVVIKYLQLHYALPGEFSKSVSMILAK